MRSFESKSFEFIKSFEVIRGHLRSFEVILSPLQSFEIIRGQGIQNRLCTFFRFFRMVLKSSKYLQITVKMADSVLMAFNSELMTLQVMILFRSELRTLTEMLDLVIQPPKGDFSVTL